MSKKARVEVLESLPREEVRARLRQASVLVDNADANTIEPVSDEELERTGDLRPGALPSEALVRQDRG